MEYVKGPSETPVPIFRPISANPRVSVQPDRNENVSVTSSINAPVESQVDLDRGKQVCLTLEVRIEAASLGEDIH